MFVVSRRGSVAEPIHFAEDERGALVERQLVERLPDAGGGFFARQQAIGKDIPFRLRFTELLQMFVE